MSSATRATGGGDAISNPDELEYFVPIYAINPDGTVKWVTSSALDGDYQYVTLTQGEYVYTLGHIYDTDAGEFYDGLIVRDTETGEEARRVYVTEPVVEGYGQYIISAVLAADASIYYNTVDGYLVRVLPDGSYEIVNDSSNEFNELWYYNALVMDDNGILYAISAANGAMILSAYDTGSAAAPGWSMYKVDALCQGRVNATVKIDSITQLETGDNTVTATLPAALSVYSYEGRGATVVANLYAKGSDTVLATAVLAAVGDTNQVSGVLGLGKDIQSGDYVLKVSYAAYEETAVDSIEVVVAAAVIPDTGDDAGWAFYGAAAAAMLCAAGIFSRKKLRVK